MSNPAELLALLPYLLGFHPASSLVVVALKESGLLNLARLDLPTTSEQEPPMRAVLTRVAANMRDHGATGAILVGYGTAELVLPCVQAARYALMAAALPLQETLRVDESRYFGLDCRNPSCCPPEGTAFDPATSATAVAAVAAGMVALPDREAVASRLAPVTGPARYRMVEATVAATQFLLELVTADAPEADEDPDTSPDTPVGQALLAAGRTTLTQVQHRYRTGRPVDDEQAALLTVLLSLPSFSDLAARCSTAEPWHLTMWTDLVRRAEPEFAAGPANLLALAALQAGDGALAGIAVERALQADPTNKLATQLAQSIAFGIDPATVTKLLAG